MTFYWDKGFTDPTVWDTLQEYDVGTVKYATTGVEYNAFVKSVTRENGKVHICLYIPALGDSHDVYME